VRRHLGWVSKGVRVVSCGELNESGAVLDSSGAGGHITLCPSRGALVLYVTWESSFCLANTTCGELFLEPYIIGWGCVALAMQPKW